MAARDGLAARRRAIGLTQDTLAEALRVERSTVARWEQGTSSPRPWLRKRLADVLELSPAELSRLLDPASLATSEPPDTASGDGLRITEPVIGHGGPLDRPADGAYVQTVREDGRRLIELDTNYGGDEIARLAGRAYKNAYRRLASGLYAPGTERDLRAAVGELAQIAAWIAYDADQQATARALTNEALLLSRLAGDRRMELFDLAQLAMQSVHLGQAGEARRIADEVIDSGPASSRVTAVFRIRRARALAQAGERSRSLGELDRANAMLSDGNARDPEWTWWVDPSELAWHRAMSLASLDDWPGAVALFEQAAELRPANTIRARYNDAAHLFEAQVAVNAWHDAEATIPTVLNGATDISSARTSALLRRVLRRIERAPVQPPSGLDDAAHALRQALKVA
jgi:transcriptional regulator with XRE-family HTH domain